MSLKNSFVPQRRIISCRLLIWRLLSRNEGERKKDQVLFCLPERMVMMKVLVVKKRGRISWYICVQVRKRARGNVGKGERAGGG